MSTAKYICFRYFIVPMEEHLFLIKGNDKEKLAWFKEAFLLNHECKIRNQEYAIRIIPPDEKQNRDLVFGKLSRKRIHAIHAKTVDDIKDVPTEDWPYLEFLCDCSVNKQLIVVEYNSAVIYTISSMKSILEELVSHALFQKGYSVRVEPIIEDTSFWNIIENAERVFSLSFILNSPNLFGAAMKANEALREVQGLYNNTCIKIGIENEKGLLKVPKDRIESYREYADQGGGEWTVITQSKERGKRKRKQSSAQRALKITTEKASNQSFYDRLKSIYDQFLRKLKAKQ